MTTPTPTASGSAVTMTGAQFHRLLTAVLPSPATGPGGAWHADLSPVRAA